jgi:hypothetical protein
MAAARTVHHHADAFIVYWRTALIAGAVASAALFALALAPSTQAWLVWFGHPAVLGLSPLVIAMALIPVTRVRIDRNGVTFRRYYGLVPSWRHRRDLVGHFQVRDGAIEYEGIELRCSRPAPIAARLEADRANFAATAA